MQPSPVVTLNRAVAVSKVRDRQAALAMIEPLEERLAGYFHFFGLKGGPSDATRPRARRVSPSTAPSRWPTRPPRPPTSACISTG
jgi:hypothetical protein